MKTSLLRSTNSRRQKQKTFFGKLEFVILDGNLRRRPKKSIERARRNFANNLSEHYNEVEIFVQLFWPKIRTKKCVPHNVQKHKVFSTESLKPGCHVFNFTIRKQTPPLISLGEGKHWFAEMMSRDFEWEKPAVLSQKIICQSQSAKLICDSEKGENRCLSHIFMSSSHWMMNWAGVSMFYFSLQPSYRVIQHHFLFFYRWNPVDRIQLLWL